MSTRSAIIRKTKTGYAGVYCHSDGYPEGPHGVGYVLATHYQDPEKVIALINLGDLSSLGERVDPIGEHSFDKPERGTTVAYMRDRREKGCEAIVALALMEVREKIDHEWAYVYEDGVWRVIKAR